MTNFTKKTLEILLSFALSEDLVDIFLEEQIYGISRGRIVVLIFQTANLPREPNVYPKSLIK
jgi:hypothetical protein